MFLIAPASANTLAKLAGGHADNLLSAAALAAPCPVIVAPAMNDRMYAHPATQANVARSPRVVCPCSSQPRGSSRRTANTGSDGWPSPPS